LSEQKTAHKFHFVSRAREKKPEFMRGGSEKTMSSTSFDGASYQRLSISRQGRVIEISLARPAQLNAVDASMHAELARVFGDLDQDDGSDVVVISGQGTAFSAGGDLTWMQRVAEGLQPAPSAREAKDIVYGLINLKKPIIAKVRGPCIGLGATIALMCDAVFADRTARFADPHVRAGLVAGDGGTVIWPLLAGPINAKRLLMTGDAIAAEEAQRLGLVSDLVESNQLDAAVAAYADRLCRGALMAIRLTKASINTHLREWADRLMDQCIADELRTFETADHREAVAAFLEKRPAKFADR
jgi:enoyl-CoA hydratase